MINPIAVNQANFDTTDILCNGESKMENLLSNLLVEILPINDNAKAAGI